MSSELPIQQPYNVFSTDGPEAEKMGIGFVQPDVSEEYIEPKSVRSSEPVISPQIQRLIDEEQSRLFSSPQRNNLLYAADRDDPFNNSWHNSINRTTPSGFMKFF